MADRSEPDRVPQQDPRQALPDTPHIVSSDDLLQGEKEVLIVHHGETYRLRCTRLGKLILCK